MLSQSNVLSKRPQHKFSAHVDRFQLGTASPLRFFRPTSISVTSPKSSRACRSKLFLMTWSHYREHISSSVRVSTPPAVFSQAYSVIKRLDTRCKQGSAGAPPAVSRDSRDTRRNRISPGVFARRKKQRARRPRSPDAGPPLVSRQILLRLVRARGPTIKARPRRSRRRLWYHRELPR